MMLTDREIATRLLTLPFHQRQLGTVMLLRRNPTLAQRLRESSPVRRSLVDQVLYDQCKTNLELFATTFFPHRFTVPFSSMHRDFFARAHEHIGKPNIREAIAAPRGAAKSTVKMFLEAMHAVCYGDDPAVYPSPPFIVVVSSRAELSVEKVKEVGDEMLANPTLLRVYGELRGETHNQGHLATRTGTRILAASPQSQVRGFLRRGKRPDKVILDDAENSTHVNTQLQRQKFHQWVMGDMLNALAPTGSVTIIGTVMHPESFMARLIAMDASRRIPGFRSATYRSVLRWNEAHVLWAKWKEIFTDPLNSDAMDDARAFYDAHEAEMTAGAEVLWPERESYYDLMVLRCIEGDLSFFAEKQNEPWYDASYLFDLAQAGYFEWHTDHIRLDDGRQLPLSMIDDVVAFWDSALGESGTRGDWSACPIVAWVESYDLFLVLDCYMTQGVPMEQQLPDLAQMLWQWDVRHVGLETNHFQSLLTGQLRQAMTRVATEAPGGWDVPPIRDIRNIHAKPLRISTLQPMLHGKRLLLNRLLPAECFRQLRDYRPLDDASHDDFPDALEGAVRVAKRLVDRRAPR